MAAKASIRLTGQAVRFCQNCDRRCAGNESRAIPTALRWRCAPLRRASGISVRPIETCDKAKRDRYSPTKKTIGIVGSLARWGCWRFAAVVAITATGDEQGRPRARSLSYSTSAHGIDRRVLALNIAECVQALAKRSYEARERSR